MKVLVTGSTGFIGKHVIDALLNYGDINIIATSSNEESLNKIFKNTKIKFLPFDIHSNKISELNLLKYFDYPDKLIHLAWKGLPNYNEAFHITDNLINDFNFLSNLIHHGLNDITVTGTCFEYGMLEGELDEKMETYPTNYYALAKDTLRKMLEIEQVQYKYDLKWVRLFYMYGFGQSSKSLISQLEIALNKGEQFFNMSGGEQIRDYLPVEEVAKNIVNIALQSEISGIINNCSGKPLRVVDFIESYLEYVDKNIKLNLGFYPYTNFEPMSFWGNNQKLKKIIK